MGLIAPDPVTPPIVAVVAGRAADAAGAGTAPAGTLGGGSPPSPIRDVVMTASVGEHRSISAAPLNAMVSAAVRDAMDHPDPAFRADDGMVPVGRLDSVADAVIAAHERRIEVLRERIGTLCAQHATGPLLDDLRGRLRRAEAARRLAGARMAGGDPAAGLAETGVERVRCGSGRVAMASTLQPPRALVPEHHAGRAPTWVQRTRMATVRHADAPAWLPVSLHAGRPVAARARRHRAVTVVAGRAAPASASAYPWRLTMVAAHYPTRTIRHVTAAHFATARLTRARRSLTAARRLLEGPASSPMTERRPVTVIVGLWRWNGSDSWRLTAHRSTAS